MREGRVRAETCQNALRILLAAQQELCAFLLLISVQSCSSISYMLSIFLIQRFQSASAIATQFHEGIIIIVFILDESSSSNVKFLLRKCFHGLLIHAQFLG
jgi:hypothetical protein